jgi:hypothetical protein
LKNWPDRVAKKRQMAAKIGNQNASKTNSRKIEQLIEQALPSETPNENKSKAKEQNVNNSD